LFIEPKLILDATIAVYDHRRTLSKSAKKLWAFATKGRVPIVVFGTGGVGKTTLGHFLETPHDRLLSMAKYERSTGLEQINIDSPALASIFIPPGQEFRRAPSWTTLYTMLAKERRVVVINVVSDGYHVVTLEQSLMAELGRPNAKRKDVLEAFLAKGRNRELEVFREVTEHLCKIETRILMITVVMKQDLWWENRDQVKKHYEAGTYSRYLSNVREAKGNQNFRHVFVSCSLLMNNLRSDDGEVLFPTARGYDACIQSAHQKKVVDELHSLLQEI
jgi:hypothetical protein